jgi:hypothetical protein
MDKWFKIPIIVGLVVVMFFATGSLLPAVLPHGTTGNNPSTNAGIIKSYSVPDGLVNATVQVPEQDADIISQFTQLGTIEEVSAPTYSGIILVGQGYMSYAMSNAAQVMASMEGAIANYNSFALVMYGGQSYYRGFFYGDYLKALGANRMAPPIELISSANQNKTGFTIDPAFMNAPIVEITFNPFGIYIANSSFDFLNATAWMMNTYLSEASAHAIHPQAGAATPMSLTMNGYTFVGTVGWYTVHYYTYLGGYSYLLGWMSVKSDYYYAEQSTAQGTYYFFLDYPTISAQGEITWWGANWLPINFHSLMGWNTWVWPGQELFSWGPQNSGLSSTISFGLGITPAGATASISYSVSGDLLISWYDTSYPAGGNASALETIWDESYGATYTVNPSSVGELNPTLSGGYLPMVMHSYYGVDNQITTLYASWDVVLYPTWYYPYNVGTGIS